MLFLSVCLSGSQCLWVTSPFHQATLVALACWPPGQASQPLSQGLSLYGSPGFQGVLSGSQSQRPVYPQLLGSQQPTGWHGKAACVSPPLLWGEAPACTPGDYSPVLKWPTQPKLPTSLSKSLRGTLVCLIQGVLSNVPGTAGGREERHRASSLHSGARGPGYRPGRPQWSVG